MRNIKLTLQFDGTEYNGWQVQPEGVTIQGVIQKAIMAITNKDSKLIGAGRTDAGVHAIAQTASFKTESKLHPDIIKRALNANLPDDIGITDCCCAADDFHPRYDAKSKIYFYLISNSRDASPFLYRYVCRLPHTLNLSTMSAAIEHLRGRHDFSSFRASGCGAAHPIRTITDISIEKFSDLNFFGCVIEGDFLKIRIEGNAFLRHMVRNIVGTLIEIGKGKFDSEEMASILNAKDRQLAGPTADARGLFLERINY
ncbi:MAG: tRNA pseudouridine(38-40) synthase TruA [Nitrospirae bacterium]|nr:tRNA pseudouridine(38-40) synthase TruA [Nitrospirota bacterium]